MNLCQGGKLLFYTIFLSRQNGVWCHIDSLIFLFQYADEMSLRSPVCTYRHDYNTSLEFPPSNNPRSQWHYLGGSRIAGVIRNLAAIVFQNDFKDFL